MSNLHVSECPQTLKLRRHGARKDCFEGVHCTVDSLKFYNISLSVLRTMICPGYAFAADSFFFLINLSPSECRLASTWQFEHTSSKKVLCCLENSRTHYYIDNNQE